MIVLFGNGVLGGKPKILLNVKGKVKAGAGKAAYALIKVMQPLDNSVGAAEAVNKLAGFVSVFVGYNKLRPAALGNCHLGIFINVAVSVTRDGDGFFPCVDKRGNAIYNNRRSKNGAV